MKKYPYIEMDYPSFSDRLSPYDRIPHQRRMSFMRKVIIVSLMLLIPLVYYTAAQRYQSLIQSYYTPPKVIRQQAKDTWIRNNTAYYWHITYTKTPNL